jgi:hypothetical protein
VVGLQAARARGDLFILIMFVDRLVGWLVGVGGGWLFVYVYTHTYRCITYVCKARK